MIEIEQVIQWLRDGGQEESADLLSQCAMTVEWVDILFDMPGNREHNLVDVKIEAPHRIISEIGNTLASQARQIEQAVQDCMRTVDCVIRSIDWVPKLPDAPPKKDAKQTQLDMAMRQLIDGLDKLLQSSEDLSGFSHYLQSEGEEWYVADQHYVQELESWASAVEAILRVADQGEYLQAWQIATEPKITVANVYDYAERLRVVLGQIKSRLEQQYNHAPGLADEVSRSSPQSLVIGEEGITLDQALTSLQHRLTIHKSNLNKLLERKAIYAAGEEPLHLLNQIDVEKAEIARLEAELKRLEK